MFQAEIFLGLSLLALMVAVGSGVYQRLRANRLGRKLQAAERRMDSMLNQDALTGLMSRSEFELALDDAVVQADRDGTPLVVLSLGLDSFRLINEAWGHASGDALLQAIAQRMATSAGDLPLARLGGDEFVLLRRGALEPGQHLATQLLGALARPFRVGTQEVSLSASAGLALYPQHGARARLMLNAGAAMHTVKAAGGAAHATYNPSMDIDHRELALLRHDLRQAVERRQLELVFQPKIDAKSLQITAAEALLRWNHPTRGVISPALFIPLAERHGLIIAIGNWVIEEACRQAAHWRDQGLRMRVAVNISGAQLRQKDLVRRIGESLRRHGLRPERFTCEITESVAMEDTLATQQAFEALRGAGMHVSIDDFGTGYSSLSSLRKLPAAELKIDRAFVADLEHSADARAIAQAIVQMAHALGLRVVAEGVETTAQRDRLVALGCDELQGFLFAKPMSATALGLWADQDDAGARPAFRDSLFVETAATPLN